MLTQCLIYQLKPGSTIAGNVDGGKAQIKLSGEQIAKEHCRFVNDNGDVTLEVVDETARTFVNGKRVAQNSVRRRADPTDPKPVKLLHGYRVILGDAHVFRFNVRVADYYD